MSAIASRLDSSTDVTYDLTIGVPMLHREEMLEQLLESASMNAHIDRVVVADNGEDSDRRLYYRDFGVELDVIDLPYDAGLGACRNALVDQTDSEYLVMVDNDMTIPRNIDVLARILERDPDLGAVAGILDEHGHLRAGVTDLSETTLVSGKSAIVQEQCGDRRTSWETGYPVARADKISNAMIIRRECVEDYCWDSNLKNGTHEDFALGHWHLTDWEFGVTPAVIFRHFTERDGDSEYYNRFRYGNQERITHWNEVVLEKWGYDTMIWGDNYWFNTARQSFSERVWKATAGAAPIRYSAPIKSLAERVMG